MDPTHRIVLEIERHGTTPHRIIIRHDEPELPTDEDGWIVVERENITGQAPIGMPEAGTVRINPMRVIWIVSVPLAAQEHAA